MSRELVPQIHTMRRRAPRNREVRRRVRRMEEQIVPDLVTGRDLVEGSKSITEIRAGGGRDVLDALALLLAGRGEVEIRARHGDAEKVDAGIERRVCQLRRLDVAER